MKHTCLRGNPSPTAGFVPVFTPKATPKAVNTSKGTATKIQQAWITPYSIALVHPPFLPPFPASFATPGEYAKGPPVCSLSHPCFPGDCGGARVPPCHVRRVSGHGGGCGAAVTDAHAGLPGGRLPRLLPFEGLAAGGHRRRSGAGPSGTQAGAAAAAADVRSVWIEACVSGGRLAADVPQSVWWLFVCGDCDGDRGCIDTRAVSGAVLRAAVRCGAARRSCSCAFSQSLRPP